jgi:hypothetical protein
MTEEPVWMEELLKLSLLLLLLLVCQEQLLEVTHQESL